MKKLGIALVIGFALYGILNNDPDFTETYVQENIPGKKKPDFAKSYKQDSTPDNDTIGAAFQDHQSNLQVDGTGVVIRILPDDNVGSRHQKFILELPSGQTLLISHNIDLAPRINSLRESDAVEFYGVYEWSAQGGVVHWTHHDPNGRHANGWLKHDGATYQ